MTRLGPAHHPPSIDRMPAPSIPSRSAGRALGRVAVALTVALGVLRLACFIVYAATEGREPLEAYHLEAKMAHLAWRVQHHVRFYPPWRDYPHVANFFGPVYFGLVGLIGRASGAGLGDLFTIGRVVTGLASVGTWILTTRLAWRRWGRGPALAAAATGVGAGPMVGFGIMARPDTLADFLGLAGFVLAVARDRRGLVPGGLLLLAAVLTKQTAALYLAAAALALAVDGRPRTAALFAIGATGLLAAIVGGVTLAVEPEFAPGLLGESRTPWDLASYRDILRRYLFICPDLLVGSIVGVWLWGIGPRRERRWAVLAAVLTVGSLAAAGKKGADLNYFLTQRAIAALALAEVAGLLRDATGRLARVLAAAAWIGVVCMAASLTHAYVQARFGLLKREAIQSPRGRETYRQFEELRARMRDPQAKVLTDRGLLDVERGERTVFGDPWLFRMLVETGQIRPETILAAIRSEEYEWIATTKPLEDPAYATYDFGMPMPLVEEARRHYVREGQAAGMFFYRPRRLVDPVPELPRPGP